MWKVSTEEGMEEWSQSGKILPSKVDEQDGFFHATTGTANTYLRMQKLLLPPKPYLLFPRSSFQSTSYNRVHATIRCE